MLGCNSDAQNYRTTRKKENAPTCRDIIENFDDVMAQLTDEDIKQQMLL